MPKLLHANRPRSATNYAQESFDYRHHRSGWRLSGGAAAREGNSDAPGTLRLLEAIRILGLEKKTRILCNHESPIRGETFVTRKITRGLARIHPAEFLQDNLVIQTNIIDAAYRRQYGFNAIAAMPTNLYGPGDNFSLQTSHVLPALLRKIHRAKERGLSEVEVWGTGKPRREFLHVTALGWSPRIELEAGIRSTYEWFLNNREVVKT